MIKDYKDLIMWQKSMTLAEETYAIVKLLPKEETYALSDQMRRAAVSVPSNIAEGYQRKSDAIIKKICLVWVFSRIQAYLTKLFQPTILTEVNKRK